MLTPKRRALARSRRKTCANRSVSYQVAVLVNVGYVVYCDVTATSVQEAKELAEAETLDLIPDELPQMASAQTVDGVTAYEVNEL